LVNIHIFSSVLLIEVLFLLKVEFFIVGCAEVILDKVLIQGCCFVGDVVYVGRTVVVSYCSSFKELTLWWEEVSGVEMGMECTW
jgi:hypothetical protein